MAVNPVLHFLRQIRTSDQARKAPDAELLARFVASRDEAAFAALVQRHGPMVWRVCTRILGNAPDAEDAFQAAFLVLARRAPAVSRPALLGNWLYGVAYRTALKVRVSAARRQACARQECAVDGVNPVDEAARRELRRVLDQELSRLPDRYRVPVVLHYLEGHTQAEVAQLLGCPCNTITTRLVRACERLRARLTRRGLATTTGGLALALSEEASAAVPPTLLDVTVKAAMLFVAGGSAFAPASAVAVAEGVIRAMFITKVKVAVACIVLLAAVATGAGLLTRQAEGGPSPEKDGAKTPGQKRESDRPAASKGEAASQTVQGKVIDESGKAVADSDIWVQIFTRELHVLHAKSDAHGKFALVIPSAKLAKVQPWNRANTIWAHAPGHQLGTGRIMLSGGASDVVIRLGPLTDTSFVVLGPDGRPCAGALVEPYYIRTSMGYEFLPEELMNRLGFRGDGRGRVQIPATAPDLLFKVRVTTRDFGIQTQRTDRSQPSAIVTDTIHLAPVGKIEGRITADRPETARGVRLVFTSEGPIAQNSGALPTEGLAEVKSDEQGRFFVPAIARGNLRIEIVVDENQHLRPELPESIAVQEGRTAMFAIPMVPTVVVRGSIRVKETGKPVPGALVHIYYGVYRQGADPVSDAQGKFTARVLPGRIGLQVIAMPAGLVQLDEPWLRPITVPPDAKEFVLPPLEVIQAQKIGGRLVDQKSQAVADVQVHVIEGNRRYGYGKSDKNGRFNMSGVPATFIAEKLKFECSLETGVPLECEIIQKSPLVLRLSSAPQK
jgi:RNA polymerase sigma factor (sigma-70 family)